MKKKFPLTALVVLLSIFIPMVVHNNMPPINPYQEVLEEINAKYGTDMRFATEEEKASYVNKAIIDCYSKEYGVDFQSVEEIAEYPEAQKNIPSFEEWRADMWQEAREISLRKEAQGKANS